MAEEDRVLARIVTRRGLFQRASFAIAAALPLLSACGQSPAQQKPAAPAAEAKPTT
ncbi:MAG: hypothetical protein H0V51_15945, partial [Chloroflexi bacterium]|nr:hypothetical protein [Chloroflexota bacterium]